MPFTRVKVSSIDCDDLLRPNSTSAVATGTSFGATQTYDLVLCDGPTLAANKVVQSVSSWSDTSITFDVNLGSFAESDALYLRIDDGNSVPVQRRVTVSWPDVSVHAGSFVASTASGVQTCISGLPSRPKAILFFHTAAQGTSQVSGQGISCCVTFAVYDPTSGTLLSGTSAARNDAASYTTKGRRGWGSSFPVVWNGSTRGSSSPTITTSGFTINWLATDTVSRVIHWIAFCGRTAVAELANGVAVSSGAFSNINFKPDLVLVAHNANAAASATDGPMFGLGAIAKNSGGTLTQWSCAWSAFSPDSSSSLVHSKLATNKFAEQVYNNAVTWSAQATALSYQTCTWSGTDTDVLQHISIYLDNAQVDIGTVTKATSASSTNVGSLSSPDAMILVTGGGTKDVVTDYANIAVGFATASHQSHARTWADLVSTLTEGTQASDTSKAIGSFSSGGSAQDTGTISLTGTPAITWDIPRAGTSEVAYIALKMPVGSQSTSATSIASGSTANAATPSSTGSASTSATAIASGGAAQTVSTSGSGSVSVSASSVASSSAASSATASPSGAAPTSASAIASSSTANGASPSATGTATCGAQVIASISVAQGVTATGTGSISTTAAAIASGSAAKVATPAGSGSVSTSASAISSGSSASNVTATQDSPDTSTASPVASGSAAQAVTPAASGSVSTAAASIASGSQARAATPSVAGTATTSATAVPASSIARAATPQPTGLASAGASSIAATSAARVANSVPTGSAASAIQAVGSTSVARSASPTAAGSASAAATTIASTAVARNATSIAGGGNVSNAASIPSTSYARAVAAAIPTPNPNPAAPGRTALQRITSRSAEHTLTARSPRMSFVQSYQLRIGDTAPPLECTLTNLPADLDNTTVRLRFRLPGQSTEQVRNASSFDVATGKATYQWEAADFPGGTTAGHVTIRWEFETTADRRGTTQQLTFPLVA